MPKQDKRSQAEKPAAEADPTKNPYYDPTLATSTGVGPKERGSRKLKFIQPGKYVSQAAQVRAKAQLEKLKQEIAESVRKTGMEAEMDLVSDASIRVSACPTL